MHTELVRELWRRCWWRAAALDVMHCTALHDVRVLELHQSLQHV